MASIPASRRARAMIFAPRSCPSSPGLATTTRILRPGSVCGSASLLAPVSVTEARLDLHVRPGGEQRCDHDDHDHQHEQPEQGQDVRLDAAARVVEVMRVLLVDHYFPVAL